MRARLTILLVTLFVVVATRSPAQVQEVARIKHEGGVNALAFSPDGRYLATGGYDRSTRVWEVPSGREIIRLTPSVVGREIFGMLSRGTTSAVAFSPSGFRPGWKISGHGKRHRRGRTAMGSGHRSGSRAHEPRWTGL